MLGTAFERATRSGRPLDPPLLVVLDEAAHIAPLPELDGLAATSASHGIQLVTIWQDLAQVKGRYGSRAPTVLNNHRAKLFLPGIADPETLEYASRLVGDEEVTQPSVTRDPRGARSTTSRTSFRRLLPPEELRCLGGAGQSWSTAPCRQPGYDSGRGGPGPPRLGSAGRCVASDPASSQDERAARSLRFGRSRRRAARSNSAGGLLIASELVEQVAAHAVEQVIAVEDARGEQCVHELRARPPARRPWRGRRRG